MSHPALPPADPLFLELQAALAGTYSIERELGRGGMGVVYLAREVKLARAVALKVLPPHLAQDPEHRERFLREAQMAARLSHPNIVPIHRVDEAGDFVYFAMAYVDGETLAQHVRTHGPLPPHRATRVLREVAWALTYAHSAGIVHRDIKPENILLERGTDRVLVADFGIAVAGRADPAGYADDGIIVGSVHYLSPEQAAGEPTDGRSDIYSLGVVGYTVLTGRVPFDAPAVTQILSMHLSAEPAPISALAPAVPGKLARAVERCLAKRPEDRHQTAAELAEALDASTAVAREIPAGLRLWLTNEEREFGVRNGVWVYLAGLTTVWLTVGSNAPPAILAIQLLLFGGVTAGTLIGRLRKLFANGYSLDDLRAALREHVMRRREEFAYEVAANPGRTPRKLLVISAAAITVGVGPSLAFEAWRWIVCRGPTACDAFFNQAGSALSSFTWAPAATAAAMVVGLATAAITVPLTLMEARRRRGVTHWGSWLLGFWNSRIGSALARVAGWRVRRGAPEQSLPQLTEIALGRATDALFESLPKATRRQLADVPEMVRRLEDDAKRLRAEIERLDTSIGTLGHDARPLTEASRSALESQDVRAQRESLRSQLRDARTEANRRLVETVAALENIRLDLLRLRVGAVQIESVTANLSAARELSEHVSRVVAANDEIEKALRSPYNLPASLSPT